MLSRWVSDHMEPMVNILAQMNTVCQDILFLYEEKIWENEGNKDNRKCIEIHNRKKKILGYIIRGWYENKKKEGK